MTQNRMRRTTPKHRTFSRFILSTMRARSRVFPGNFLSRYHVIILAAWSLLSSGFISAIFWLLDSINCVVFPRLFLFDLFFVVPPLLEGTSVEPMAHGALPAFQRVAEKRSSWGVDAEEKLGGGRD
eukprot:CAMPEP_0173465876 /NCGR_PEP_ID=MMETSP1357-20121228/72364_1 /TAXON_ID=77926 /ORGANISM="Hemiselmis rufescens, Strain PCC563" /LENGTH=125 /DNA_ID=CAMNT_0014433885 /DNA_START=189 /DNA_END=566 /DNA_ORIENTATION=-